MLEELESKIAQSSFIKSLVEKDNEKTIGKVEDNDFHNSMLHLQLIDNQLTILKCLKNIINNGEKEKETPTVDSTIDPVVGDLILTKHNGICKVRKDTDILRDYGYKDIFYVIDLSGRHLSFRGDFEFPVPDSYWKLQEFKFRDKATVFIYGVKPIDVVIIGLGLSGRYRVVFSDGNFGSYLPEELRPVFPDKF
jgi:hypothetical protein